VLIEEAFLVAAFGLETFLRTLRSRSYWTLMWRAAKQREVSSCSWALQSENRLPSIKVL
jgi:hypothetical protein